MNVPELYEIRVKGYISAGLGTQFEGVVLRLNPDGSTVLSGQLDQSALHGTLMKISNLGLKLISVCRVDEGKTQSEGE